MFIGTAGSAPTARRGLPSTLVRRGGDRLLFDCGEGTQRQLLRSIGLLDLEEIFLTHFHADHFLGLPGMLKTFGLRGREAPLTIYGPRGLRALFELLRPVIGGDGLPGQPRRARAERAARARRLHRRAVPRAAPRHRLRLRARRAGPARAASTRRGRARSVSRRARTSAASSTVRPSRSTVASCRRRRSWGSRGAAASSCSPATRSPPTRRARWHTAPTCWCTRRPSRPRRPTGRPRPATRRPAARRSWPPPPRSTLLALTHVSPRYPAGRAPRRGPRGLRGDDRPARLRPSRDPLPGTRRPGARQGGAGDPERRAAVGGCYARPDSPFNPVP